VQPAQGTTISLFLVAAIFTALTVAAKVKSAIYDRSSRNARRVLKDVDFRPEINEPSNSSCYVYDLHSFDWFSMQSLGDRSKFRITCGNTWKPLHYFTCAVAFLAFAGLAEGQPLKPIVERTYTFMVKVISLTQYENRSLLD